MSDLSDDDLFASIRSEEQFAALDSTTQARLLKRERGATNGSGEAGAVFDDAAGS